MISPAYWAPAVAASDAKEHALFAEIQHAGPWQYASHPHGGAVATWVGCAFDCDMFNTPAEIADGLHYYSPRVLPSIYDLAREDRGTGVDVRLACGIALTIPVATHAHRQLRLGRRGDKIGDPVTEYGRLAVQLMDRAKVENGIMHDDPLLARLLALAVAQRYHVTAELLDDLAIIASEDIEPLLGAIWTGDPKALAPAIVGEINVSRTCDSTGAK